MKLVILDRDGVINHDSSAFVKSPDEWVALPGSLEAIARLSQAGWRVVVASNQSGLARGLFSTETLNAIHAKMRSELAQLGGHIDSIFLCPHGPDDGCACRKPKPGMFLDIAHRYDIDLQNVPAVGDSLRDLQASRPDTDLFFITGADAIAQILSWRDVEELWKLAHFVAVSRPGHLLEVTGLPNGDVSLLEVPALAISSTDCRDRVSRGFPVWYLVPDGVVQYISKHHLYRSVA